MTQTTPSSVDAMRQALEDVCNPLGYLRRKAEAEGNRLGGMAYAIANDIATVQQIARDALSTLPSDGVTIPADHVADAGTMVAARLRDEIGREAKDWRHNAYTSVMLAQWHDRLAAAPKAPPVAQAEGVWRERWYGSEPEKGSAITDERGNLVAYFGGDETTHAAVTKIVALHNAALSATTEQREGEATGTFACPICGQDTPHHHGAEAVDALQNKGSRK